MSYDLEYGKYRNKPLLFLRNEDPDYGDAVYLKTHWPKTFDLVNSTSYDENAHAGAPEDKANYEYWKENYAATEGKSWWDLGHTNGILVRIPLLTKDERESYEYLEDNFELDEDRTQTIKMEMETEQWDDYGRDEYKDALKKGSGDDNVEELIDAIPDEAFDKAVFEMWARLDSYVETSGWEVNFPDADNSFNHDKNFTNWDLDGVINWFGIDHEITVRLSPRAFCRLHEGDREFSYPGALYRRYGEEWVLNVTLDDILQSIHYTPMPGWGKLDYAHKFKELLDAHLDENAEYIGFENAPSVKMVFNRNICQSTFLICDIDYIEEAKIKILQGPEVVWDEELAETDPDAAQKKYDADLILQRVHSDMVESVRNLTIEGALEVCDVDPSSDLVERVVELVLLDAPERNPETLKQPSTQRHLKEVACQYIERALEQRPPFCSVRQLKLPMASEKRRRASSNPTTPPKALANKAVAAMRVYLGSVGKVTPRDEQRLYDRVRKAIEKMAQGTGAGWNDWWPAVADAAQREGLRTAMPGKDI